jgi:predicted ATPase/DNA-binding SARP family transcriptional activator
MSRRPKTLEIRVFGPFSAAVDGERVPAERWQRLQAKTLLKLLALAPNHALHREVLMELLWPEADPALAANNLNKVIHAARRSLEPSLVRGSESAFVATRERLVFLEAPGRLTVDAVEFERFAEQGLAARDPKLLEAALRLYRGEPLEEDRYDQRFEPRRARLQALHADVLRTLSGLLKEGGDPDRGIALLQALVERDPLDEPAVRRLMGDLAAAGYRDRAAQAYAAFQGRLREEVGAEPEDETRLLLDRILSSGPPSRPAPATQPARLPRPATRFIGREDSVARVGELVRSERLVTLAGPGGIGKTRLAQQVCRAEAGAFPGGVWVVELAGLEEPAFVEAAVAAALGLRDRRDTPLADAIAAAGRGRALLVLDNCEHVAGAVAGLAAELLAATDSLHVLTTSREVLGAEGENVWRVPPLTVPPGDRPPLPGELPRFEATALFLDRLRMHDQAFPVTEAAAETIAQLCHRLDGLPLAIEIAAAAAATLGLDQVTARLDRILTLEHSPRRSEPGRHRTLKAVMDWSYGLLSAGERALLRRLSVFAGGFTLEAAEGACAGDGLAAQDVSSLLARLVESSLVNADTHGEQARFGLLETVRLYADGRCAEEDDRDRWRRAHARWYADFVEALEAELRGQHQRFAMARLDAERENLWAALRSSQDGPAGEPGVGVRLCAVLWLWLQRANLGDARARLEAALAAAGDDGPPGLRARLLHGLGNYCHLQGDLARSVALLEESVALWRSADDRYGLVRSLQTLGSVLAIRGDYARAGEVQSEAAEVCRELDDAFCMAQVSFARGVLAIYAGELAEAQGLMEDALAGYRALGTRGNEMAAVHNLAEIALLGGDLDRAERLGRECLDLSRRLGERLITPHSICLLGDVAALRGAPAEARDLLLQAAEMHRAQRDRQGMIHALESLARLECMHGGAEAALRALAAAEAAREQYGMPVPPYRRPLLEQCRREARRRLGPDLARAVSERGRSTPLDTAVRVAFG